MKLIRTDANHNTVHVLLGVLPHANSRERENISTIIHCPASKTMEFLGDVYDNLDRDDAFASTPPMTVIDDNSLKSPIEGEEDNSSQAKVSKVRDESFESKTAVIDEAKGTALRWIGITDTNVNDSVHSTENELISVEEAVALWKNFGEGTSDEESEHPCLDGGQSLLNSEEALVGSTKITFEDNVPFGKYISVCQEQSEKNFENFGMHRGEDERGRRQTVLASERAPKARCSDSMAAISCEALQTRPTPALITPTNENDESDYPFPDLIRGTKDVFANTDLLQKEARHDISPDIFSNEFSTQNHPGTLEHLLWNRLASLCEPIQLESLEETQPENEIILESTNESKTVTPGKS